MILQLALAQIECFEGNISATVKSAGVVRVSLARNQYINAYQRQYCDKLEASRRTLTLTTPTCEYTSEDSGLEVVFVNRTCTTVSDTFFYLYVRYTEQSFSQLLTVAYILVTYSSVDDGVTLLQLRYAGDAVILRYKFNYTFVIDGPALFVVKDKLGTVILSESLPQIANYQGQFAYTGLQSVVARLQSPDYSLFEAGLDFLVPFVQNESAPNAVQQSHSYSFNHRQWIYDRSLEAVECLEDLSVSQFEDRILLQYKKVADANCASAGVNLITVETMDGGAAHQFAAAEFSFDTTRYYVYGTSALPELHEHVVVGFLSFSDGVSTFSYRKQAAVTIPCLDGLSLALRPGQICVRALLQCESSMQVRRYTLHIYEGEKGKSYDITDFYPLDEYCFEETDRKVLLRIEKQRNAAVFEIDDHDVYIFNDIALQLDYFVKYEDFIILAACSTLFVTVVLLVCRRYNGF